MSKKASKIASEPTNISKYYYIMNGETFTENIFGKDNSPYYVSDGTEMWHLQLKEKKLKKALFYHYGYKLKDMSEKLWEVLASIEKNLQASLVPDLSSFWVIPNCFCVSHSHYAKDVFRIEYLAQNIAASEYDIIIELRNKAQEKTNKNNNIFNELVDKYEQKTKKYTNIYSDESDFGIKEIKKLINKIDNQIKQGKTILFHSQGRTDRLGLVLACWLIKHKLADSDNFIDKIMSFRKGPLKKFKNDQSEENVLERREIQRRYWYISDESRYVVPFLFNKSDIEGTKYGAKFNRIINRNVDTEVLEILNHFYSKKVNQHNDKIEFTNKYTQKHGAYLIKNK